MNTIKLLSAMTLLTTLTACSDGSGSGSNEDVSVTSDGYCTTAFVSSYNNVVFEATMLKNYIDWNKSNSQISQQAQVLKNACEQFFPKHANVSCKAEVNYKETMIASNDKQPVCDAAQTILNSLSGSN